MFQITKFHNVHISFNKSYNKKNLFCFLLKPSGTIKYFFFFGLGVKSSIAADFFFFFETQVPQKCNLLPLIFLLLLQQLGMRAKRGENTSLYWLISAVGRSYLVIVCGWPFCPLFLVLFLFLVTWCFCVSVLVCLFATTQWECVGC